MISTRAHKGRVDTGTQTQTHTQNAHMHIHVGTCTHSHVYIEEYVHTHTHTLQRKTHLPREIRDTNSLTDRAIFSSATTTAGKATSTTDTCPFNSTPPSSCTASSPKAATRISTMEQQHDDDSVSPPLLTGTVTGTARNEALRDNMPVPNWRLQIHTWEAAEGAPLDPANSPPHTHTPSLSLPSGLHHDFQMATFDRWVFSVMELAVLELLVVGRGAENGCV